MPSPEGKKTILVVDDEPEVRKLVGAMVSRYGFNVLTADTGEHAITLFKKKIDEIDLLLTDVVAPGMSGPMLADKLAELKPGPESAVHVRLRQYPGGAALRRGEGLRAFAEAIYA